MCRHNCLLTSTPIQRLLIRSAEQITFQSIFKEQFKEFTENYDEKYTQTYGRFRTERIAEVVENFISCGDYTQGIARIQCTNPDCKEEFFRPFSCKGFYLCPSCSQKRSLLFSEYMHEQLLLRLPHRQFVWTFPMRTDWQKR